FVHEMVAKGLKLPQVCEELMDRCLASESELGGVGCDNMTVVIVGLLNGKTEDEWYAHVKSIYDETDVKVSTEINRPQGAAAAEIDEASERVNAVVQEIRSARAAGEADKEEPAGASGVEEAPKPSDQ
ncbi:Protein phosphatase 2C 2, partial [Linderina pennispora]